MHDKERNAVLLSLIEHINEEQGFCGETDVQMRSYILQEWMGAPLDYQFVFYGSPTSFEVRNDLAHMYANNLIGYRLHSDSKWRSLRPGEYSSRLETFYDRIEEFRDAISFVGEITREKTPSELRRLGTALYISREEERTLEERAQRLRELQPYVSERDASAAVKGADELEARVTQWRENDNGNGLLLR